MPPTPIGETEACLLLHAPGGGPSPTWLPQHPPTAMMVVLHSELLQARQVLRLADVEVPLAVAVASMRKLRAYQAPLLPISAYGASFLETMPPRGTSVLAYNHCLECPCAGSPHYSC